MSEQNHENEGNNPTITTTLLPRKQRIGQSHNTTHILVRQLASIDFEKIKPIQKTKHTPYKLIQTIDSIQDVIEKHGLDPGRCLDFFSIDRRLWHDWLNYAKQGQEPYYSKLKKLKSVVLGWLCGLSSKVYNLKGAKGAELADKALERFFRDSERDRQAANPSQQTNIQIVNLGEYGLDAEAVGQDVSELMRLKAKSKEISSVPQTEEDDGSD